MNDQPLVFAQLSDVHFRRRGTTETNTLDDDLRNELERDLTALGKEFGGFDGILVCGDVVFSGKKEEYEQAGLWLEKLCQRVGCPTENVWMVPGNHDVDRGKLAASGLLRMMQDKLRNPSDAHERNSNVTEFLKDLNGRELIYSHISAYNEFAARFGCHFGPEQPFWEKDFRLNDDSVLRLRGLNSTLTSHAGDDTGNYKLALGSRFCALQYQEGVEYITLCHHPHDWLCDADEITDYLDNKARVQLFGHKHRQRSAEINRRSLRLHSGALNPDPKEGGYQPRYNVVTLTVVKRGVERWLLTDVHGRVWNPGRVCFQADFTVAGATHEHYEFRLDAWEPETSVRYPLPLAAEGTLVGSPPEAAAATPPRTIETGRRFSMNPVRRLTYRFLTLPYRLRLEVARQTGLLNDEDEGVSDAERFRRYFQRARDAQRLAQFWSEIESRHHDGQAFAENPFAEPLNTILPAQPPARG